MHEARLGNTTCVGGTPQMKAPLGRASMGSSSLHKSSAFHVPCGLLQMQRECRPNESPADGPRSLVVKHARQNR